MGCQRDAPPQQQGKQQDHRTGPDEAQFLAQNGKDEVVLRLGHEQVLLAAVAKAQPCRAAAANGVQALNGLVTVAQRVGEWVQPGAEAAGRVGHKVRHDDNGRPDGSGPAHARQHEPPQPGAAHEHEYRADA